MDIDDLEIYRESMRFGDAVWNEVTPWDYFAKDTVGKQLVRCANSIAATIAESHGRFHSTENKNFCRYARGSLQKFITFLTKAQNRNLISPESATTLINVLTFSASASTPTSAPSAKRESPSPRSKGDNLRIAPFLNP